MFLYNPWGHSNQSYPYGQLAQSNQLDLTLLYDQCLLLFRSNPLAPLIQLLLCNLCNQLGPLNQSNRFLLYNPLVQLAPYNLCSQSARSTLSYQLVRTFLYSQ